MGEVHRIGSIEIDQDLDAQRREWRVCRIAWVGILLTLAAGLAGLLGSGPLARATAGDADLRVEYERFAHATAPGRLRIVAPVAGGREVGLWIDREYLEALELKEITPEPDRVESGARGLVYTFRAADGASEVAVDVCFEYRSCGILAGSVGRAGDEHATSFRHVVYP